MEKASKRFVVVSGLPGSGKSTLARRLAAPLELAVIDKDDILEQLFESKGTGDAAWRRALSRESDAILPGSGDGIRRRSARFVLARVGLARTQHAAGLRHADCLALACRAA